MDSCHPPYPPTYPPSYPPQVVRGRFTNIGLVSALVGGLAQLHDSLGIAFVDQVWSVERHWHECESLLFDVWSWITHRTCGSHLIHISQVLEDIRWGLENPLLGECGPG